MTNTVTKHIFITTTGYSSITVPSDFQSLVSVEALGSGGQATVGGGGSGGGGAYAISTNMTGVTAGQSLYCYVGAGGATLPTWINTSNAAPTSSTTGVKADYGHNGTSSAGTGGSAASCVPTTGAYSGGAGNASGYNTNSAGGGGAASPFGNGQAGGTSTGAGEDGGGGGGAGGIRASAGSTGVQTVTGGAGGNGPYGVGGAPAAPSSAGFNATSGSGGGGGGGRFSSVGGNGAIYNLWYGSIYPNMSGYGTWAGPSGGAGGGWAGGGTAGYGGGGAASNGGGSGIIVFTYVGLPTIEIGNGVNWSGIKFG